jgi:hypothetical protein
MAIPYFQRVLQELQSSAGGGGNILPIDLADNVHEVTGVLDETNGGTGQSTITQGDLLYGSAANVLSKLAKGRQRNAVSVQYRHVK